MSSTMAPPLEEKAPPPEEERKTPRIEEKAKEVAAARGLLLAPDGKFWGPKFVAALCAEFLGTLLFAFQGSVTPSGQGTSQQGGGTAQANWAPWGNGFALLILVYATANVSGGHLNPAVTLATILTGHIKVIKGLAYMVVQITGGVFGVLLVAGLVPGIHPRAGTGPGCFGPGAGVTDGQVFGWELVMTFVLVSVVYAVAIGEPSFGNSGPMVVGLALFALVFAGGSYTGTAINPARAIAPTAIFGCNRPTAIIYVVGEFVGGAVAGLLAGPLYGVANPWLQRLLPWHRHHLARARSDLRRKHRTQRQQQQRGSARGSPRDLELGPHGTPEGATPSHSLTTGNGMREGADVVDERAGLRAPAPQSHALPDQTLPRETAQGGVR